MLTVISYFKNNAVTNITLTHIRSDDTTFHTMLYVDKMKLDNYITYQNQMWLHKIVCPIFLISGK